MTSLETEVCDRIIALDALLSDSLSDLFGDSPDISVIVKSAHQIAIGLDAEVDNVPTGALNTMRKINYGMALYSLSVAILNLDKSNYPEALTQCVAAAFYAGAAIEGHLMRIEDVLINKRNATAGAIAKNAESNKKKAAFIAHFADNRGKYHSKSQAVTKMLDMINTEWEGINPETARNWLKGK
jgi:hypothetical protein